MSKFSEQKKKIIPVLILLLAALGLAIYFVGSNSGKFEGIIEATVVPYASEVSGKILEMPMEIGEHVSAGDVLAVIDSTDQEYSLKQLEITLEKKKLALADVDISSGDNQAGNSISVAQAAYNSAKATYSKAYQDYKNASTLYGEGAIPKDAFDSAKLKSDSAANSLQAAKAQLDIASSTSSAETTELDIAQIESQIQQMKEDLAKFTIKAAQDGVVMSKSYIAGDMVAPGYSLTDIAADGEKYFMFYIPREDLNRIDYNQTFTITKDGKKYEGIVKFIDVESEYTPKDMQTAANKNRDSVKVKLLLSPGNPLKPGETAELKIQ